LFASPFDVKPNIQIPDDTEVIVVADLFTDQYVGGAELTTQALIDSSPFKVFKLRAKDVTMSLLEKGHRCHWIFGNFATMDINLIPTIVANMHYSVLEYDYKYCKYRSAEKHLVIEKAPCNCHNEMHGKMISAFFHGAKTLWWMAEQQLEKYVGLFPFLQEKSNVILSSVFDDRFFLTVKLLREKYKGQPRKGWLICGSPSWIKGTDQAEQWCKDNDKKYEILWEVPYEEVLEKMARAEGLVYLPQGDDTCPRMVIEAKLLGCQLHLNEFVQHVNELWFDTDDGFDTEAYLYAARERFWAGIKHAIDWRPSISGYTTSLNCIRHRYPWEASIQSMLGFCDEVIVVDGGSDDGTWEKLTDWAEEEPKLRVHLVKRDWNHTRFAVFDGMQKAAARAHCTGDMCWQLDADEVVHETDTQKIFELARNFPAPVDIISLPVIEYWGGSEKVRVDVNPWKWRLTRNKPHITHGIPRDLRRHDSTGDLYALPGTDGCDYVHNESFERIPHASFYTQEIHDCRLQALAGNEEAQQKYNQWFNVVTETLPAVHHYSWYDLKRKIKTYRDYWSKHWQSLYDIRQHDSAENNMFFQKPWAEVTEDDISDLAARLSKEMGGWVFHDPIDFSRPTPHVILDRTEPAVIESWSAKEQ